MATGITNTCIKYLKQHLFHTCFDVITKELEGIVENRLNEEMARIRTNNINFEVLNNLPANIGVSDFSWDTNYIQDPPVPRKALTPDELAELEAKCAEAMSTYVDSLPADYKAKYGL